MKNVVNRTHVWVKKNVIYYLKSIMQRKGFESRDGELTEGKASIQHPFSIHSASIGHPLQAGGKQVASSLMRSWKYVATLTLLLTLNVGQMWGDTNISYSGGYIYFADTYDVHKGSTQLCGRKSNCSGDDWYTAVTNLSNINHTKLYYTSSLEGSGWSNVCWAGWALISNSSGKSNSKTEYWSGSNSTWYSGFSDYGFNSGSTYLITVASASKGASTTTSYKSSGYSALNNNQTVYKYTSSGETSAASYTAQSVNSGTVTISAYKMTGNGTASNSSNSGTINTANTTSLTKSAAFTGEVTLTASANSGYTFMGWFESTSATTAVSTETTYTYNAPNSTKSIYARFKAETTHSVNITYVCASPSATVSTATSQAIGEVTAASITAPTVTGYTFSGWTLGNGISNQSGSTTANPISVKTKSSGTYTMQANYTEDLSSPYTIKGGTNLTGDNWVAHAMTKKTGHSTESVAYYTFSISSTNSGISGSADDWSFKICQGDTWYGLTATGSYWWERSTSGAKSLNTSGANIQVVADVAGNYEVKVDYSTPASPTVTVTFPTKYSVTYSVSPSGAANAITTSPSVTSGGYVASGTSVTFTHAAAKTGYTWTRWENGSGSSLGTGSTYTTTISANTTVVAKYTENTYTVTVNKNPSAGGSVTPTSATSMGQINGGNITATANTGYTFTKWTITTGTGYFGTSGTSITSTTASTKFRPTATATIRANFTANTYSVKYNANGGSGSMSNSSHTYGTAKALTTNAFTRSGYTFAGWATSEGGSVVYSDGQSVTNLSSTQGATVDLYAKWTAKTYTVNLSQTGAATTGTTSVTATYASAMPTAGVSMPTAAAGYGFMGYFANEDGEGTQYYKADGTSARTWNIDVNPTTLYAYFKKAQITNLTFSPAIVDLSGTVSVTATIAPTPVGTKHIEWRLLYSNGNEYETQPTFTPVGDNGATFTAPNLAATYKLEATLRTGTTPGSGTVLSTYTGSFQVAGEHTVTVKYMSGSYTIQPSTTITGKPLAWTSITAPDLTGYTFTRWVGTDGITINGVDNGALPDTATTATIRFKAIYDGTLTAVYTKKRMIYFYNTLNWGSVYVYFYKNDSYWQTVSPYKGSGSKTTFTWTDTPYSLGLHGQMLPVSEGSNIYYFDAEAAGVPSSYDDVVFTEHSQHDYEYFYQTNAVRRGDYKSSMPMFVPLADQTADVHNETNYYNSGYWMNYPENTGYTLKIYNAWDAAKETAAVREYPFPYSNDLIMPLKMDVEFNEGNHDYWFMVYRNDGTYLGSTFHFKQGYQDEQAITGGNNKNKITTSAPGNYKFILTYHDNGSGTTNYYIDVDFPIATGDYRIYYSDNATWSQGAHTKDSWCHPSHSIAKATDAKNDTISFFVSKGDGISHTMKFQKASVTEEGVVSWSDVAGGSITIPSNITESGVYNFIVSQPDGGASISLEKAEPYTGNFYIRTDCAGNTKWDNYKADDHLMQYSDYAAANEDFTHYFVHWVRHGRNVKFVIANDYSPCISDTLIKDDPDLNNMDEYGNLYVEDGKTDWESKYSANIRFMWNQGTNAISRAYVNGSSNINNFIIMRGPSSGNMIYNESGNRFTAANTGLSIDDAINLRDDQNFIYETTIKANPQARIKLTANYNGNTQYFKGDDDASFTGEHGVEILGGTIDPTDKEKMRIVYDFKTNRLVCAWLPSDEDITGTLDINADVMIIREHQEEAQQITFTNSGDKLDEVKTVYGVMRFNRWTLANKDKSTHLPLADPKSNYERQIYFISFPFDVKLSDIFGMGRYDDRWWIEYYDGADRAAKGFFQETKTFWKFMENTPTAKLKANQGYILNLDETMLHSDDESIWTNNIDQVELFFPSASEVGDIEKKNTTSTLDEHTCTININPAGSKNPGDAGYIAAKDRRMRDSHWNCLGVPSYANYSGTLQNGSSTNITWSKWGVMNEDLPFLYTWNPTDNSLSPTPTSTYPFKTMNAYMVQYHGTLNWATASAPHSVAARRNPAFKSSYMFRLELQKEGQKTEQTFVNLRDNDNVSAAFDFNYDLSNEGCAIYTTTSDLVTVAGNCLPLALEQETSVPVGVVAKVAGAYTFAMPDGTEGLSVTLVDNITGTHTNLALGDYTVELEAGTYDNRFMLVIDPRTTTTSVETVGAEGKDAPRKVFINGLMYIQRGNALYDTTGRKVE